MHLNCTRASEYFYKPCTCCTPYDRVIYQHYTLAAYGADYGVKLYLYLILAHVLTRGYKGSAYVFILNKSYCVGNTRLLGISKCRVKTRVGNTDNNVSLNRMRLS